MKLTLKKCIKNKTVKTAQKSLKLKNFAAFAVIAFFAGVVFLPAVKNISAEESVIPEAKWDENAKLYYSMPDDDYANAIPVNTEVYSYSINPGEYLNGAGTVTIYDMYLNKNIADYLEQKVEEFKAAGNLSEEEYYKTLYPSEYIIPEKVRINGKEYYVTKIGKGFLHYNVDREYLGAVNYYRTGYYDEDSFSVKLPDTIREIQNQAFYGVSSLKDINFPENLEKIGDLAFYMSGISKIDLPESVRHVGIDAFFYVCYDTSQPLILPEGVEVGQGSFYFDCGPDQENKLTVKVRDLKITASEKRSYESVFGEVENLYIEKNITFSGFDLNNLRESIRNGEYHQVVSAKANNIYLTLDENQHGELPDSLKVVLATNLVNAAYRDTVNLFADCSVNLGEMTYAAKRYGGYEKIFASVEDYDDIATEYPEFWQLYEKYINPEADDVESTIYASPENMLNYMLYITEGEGGVNLKIHQSCEVKFEENGGNSVADLPKVEKGVLIDEPEISREGYELEGWYLDADFREKYAFEKGVLQNMTLYAKWKKNLEISSESFTIEGEEIPFVEPNPENPPNPNANIPQKDPENSETAKNPNANSAKKFKLIAPNTAQK